MGIMPIHDNTTSDPNGTDFRKDKKQSSKRVHKTGTHVAVAANISCLLALVHTVIVKAKKSVKTMTRHIFNVL